VWTYAGKLLLRKGDTDLGGGLKAAKIIRIWGTSAVQMLAQVVLSGPGVTAANNQALVLRQVNNSFFILARSGTQAPGIAVEKIKLGSFTAIDVDRTNGHYVILASLTGAPANANQVLISGRTTLGNDTTDQRLRLPNLLLRKGERYSTATSLNITNTIKSIAIKPAVDPTGVGGRGLAQIINENGEILVILTGLTGAQELVKLTP
jgi:hypothetical protein